VAGFRDGLPGTAQEHGLPSRHEFFVITAERSMATTEYISRDRLEKRLPRRAPGFLCPSCHCALQYEGSETSESGDPINLADIYRCPMGCGTYEHDRRTHRLWLVP
jgi:hypothetical protein